MLERGLRKVRALVTPPGRFDFWKIVEQVSKMSLDEVYEADFRCNLHFKTFPVNLEGSRGQVWGPGGRKYALNLELRIEVVKESLAHGPTVAMAL